MPEEIKQKKWISCTEAVKLTGLSHSTIIRYIKEGRFDAKRLSGRTNPWYIDYLSIPAFLRKEYINGSK